MEYDTVCTGLFGQHGGVYGVREAFLTRISEGCHVVYVDQEAGGFWDSVWRHQASNFWAAGGSWKADGGGETRIGRRLFWRRLDMGGGRSCF